MYDPLRVMTLGTLSAPGSTSGHEVTGECTFMYTIASINTSVTVKLEVSADNSAWALAPGIRATPVAPSADTVTNTVNGTYAISWTGVARYVRFTFVSEVGGTAATIAVKGCFA